MVKSNTWTFSRINGKMYFKSYKAVEIGFFLNFFFKFAWSSVFQPIYVTDFPLYPLENIRKPEV